ncbi:MAG: caspase family protein [Leptospiraceae bacterium]|nr:caspase family protein [Leptospiraceae bacterium]
MKFSLYKWFLVLFFFLNHNIFSEKNQGMYDFLKNKEKEKTPKRSESLRTIPGKKQIENKSYLEDSSSNEKETNTTIEKKIDPIPEVIEEEEKEFQPYQPSKKYVLKRKGIGGTESDDDTPPPLNNLEGNEGKRYALVIGINDYNDPEIPDLSKARNDAKALGKILKERGQFDEVDVMTDDIDSKNNLYPTKLNIMEKMESILNYSTPNDLIVFFFSGHGISDNNEKGYLVTVDTVADKQYNTALKVDHLVERLKEFKIKKSLLILDACREVVKETKSTSQNRLKNQEFLEAESTAVFYSTAKGQFSYEDDQTDYGVFTKYLIYGMEGKADFNDDYVVTFGELASFVESGVNKWSRDRNKRQRPFTKIYGEKSGDLALTLKDDSGTSFVDKPIPKILSKYEITGLSTLAPGLGQHKNDRTFRGYPIGVPYLIMGGLGTAYFLLNYQKMEKLRSEYINSPLIPYSRNIGETSALNYFVNQTKLSAFENQYTKTNQILGVLLGFWAWNIFDAYYNYHQSDFFSFDFDYRMQNYNNTNLEAYGNFQLDLKF